MIERGTDTYLFRMEPEIWEDLSDKPYYIPSDTIALDGKHEDLPLIIKAAKRFFLEIMCEEIQYPIDKLINLTEEGFDEEEDLGESDLSYGLFLLKQSYTGEDEDELFFRGFTRISHNGMVLIGDTEKGINQEYKPIVRIPWKK